jgi:hypothetical protein
MAVGPDGTVVFLDYDEDTGTNLWKLAPDGTVSPVVSTPFQERSGSISPDGKTLAYTSDESGRSEVYTIAMSGPGSGRLERTIVSVDGGTGPVWSRQGNELFYRSGDDLVAVEVLATDPVAFGARRKLLDVAPYEPQYFHEFDVAPDGERFLFVRAEPGARPTRLDVVTNWFPELERKAAAR